MLKRKRASSNLKEQYALANQEYEHTKCDLWIDGSLQQTTSVCLQIREKNEYICLCLDSSKSTKHNITNISYFERDIFLNAT